jgi:hypothetical protein
MPKGPIKSTLAAKKARRLAVGSGRTSTYKTAEPTINQQIAGKPGSRVKSATKTLSKPLSKREEKKGAKKEMKSAAAALTRVSAKTNAAPNATWSAGTRVNNATRRIVDAKVSSKASGKAVDKGQKMVLKGMGKREAANAKYLKKITNLKNKTDKISKRIH